VKSTKFKIIQMEIHFAQISPKKIFKEFKNRNDYAVIDTVQIKSEFKPEKLKKLETIYIINQEILKLFSKYAKSKKYKALLYTVEKIDEEFINNIDEFLHSNEAFFTKKVLLDITNSVDPRFYYFFDEIQ
jgi:hypothetical protein